MLHSRQSENKDGFQAGDEKRVQNIPSICSNFPVLDEYYCFFDNLLVLVTASKDQSVGVYRLGPPSHGVTEYGEIR